MLKGENEKQKPPSDIDLKQAFKDADTDGNGTLDFEEFTKLYAEVKKGNVIGLGSGSSMFAVKSPLKKKASSTPKKGIEAPLVMEVMVNGLKDQAAAEGVAKLVKTHAQDLVEPDAFGPCTAANVVTTAPSPAGAEDSKAEDTSADETQDTKAVDTSADDTQDTKAEDMSADETQGGTDGKSSIISEERSPFFTVSFQVTLANESAETFPEKQALFTAALVTKLAVDEGQLEVRLPSLVHGVLTPADVAQVKSRFDDAKKGEKHPDAIDVKEFTKVIKKLMKDVKEKPPSDSDLKAAFKEAPTALHYNTYYLARTTNKMDVKFGNSPFHNYVSYNMYTIRPQIKFLFRHPNLHPSGQAFKLH